MNVADDLPPYPREWTPHQRATAYWHALRIDAQPQMTSDWVSILAQAERIVKRHTSSMQRTPAATTTTRDHCVRCERYDRITLDRRGVCASCRLDQDSPPPTLSTEARFSPVAATTIEDIDVPW